MTRTESNIEKAREVLLSFDTAMLVTQGLSNSLRGRPMAIAHVEQTSTVWFFTGRATSKVHEIEDNQEVLIVCQKDPSRYLSLRGQARLNADQYRIREYWKETYRTWFPEGPEDLNLVLIGVKPDEIEYWDNHGVNGVRYVFEAIKAYTSGTTPHVKEGEQHGHIVVK